MAGHRRHNGIIICPDGDEDEDAFEMEEGDEQPDDAPPSPPPSPGQRGQGPPLMRPFTEFSIPEDRPWHRKNPNWVEPPRRRRPLQAEHEIPQIVLPASPNALQYNRDGSTVSTVLAEHDLPPRKNDDEGDELPPDAEPPSPDALHAVFTSEMRLASVFSVTPKDVNQAQRTARTLGLHTGFIPKPTPAPSDQRRARALSAQRSWWMVVGKDDRAVQHLLDAHQKETPGRLDEEPRVGYAERQGFPVSFLQLVIASAIGGLIVLYGLSSF